MLEDWIFIFEDDDLFDEEGDEDVVFDSIILLEFFFLVLCNLVCLILGLVGIWRELFLFFIVC